ncbi:cytochrome c oxidase assembly protein COX20, mitochondrial [Adelges cooleyi]|uniref:cytochrome c oxidase assembly protein COX20, mitochondrial n=1 Tax=Adelges cooleyi TaxID=133065 RepID=UPI00218015F4|nr:cytochrome c oxidase assembly protein COX20, mitochondrial [Adelges cooleyi]
MASISSDDDHKAYMFLGKDVSKIPCFRNSYLYSIVGGFVAGLGHFMFTSRTQRSMHFGVGSFCVIASSYWTFCRYNYSQTEKTMDELKKVIQEKTSS